MFTNLGTVLTAKTGKTYLDDPGDILLGDKKICNSWKMKSSWLLLLRINSKSGHAFELNQKTFQPSKYQFEDFSIWWPENNNLRIQRKFLSSPSSTFNQQLTHIVESQITINNEIWSKGILIELNFSHKKTENIFFEFHVRVHQV